MKRGHQVEDGESPCEKLKKIKVEAYRFLAWIVLRLIEEEDGLSIEELVNMLMDECNIRSEESGKREERRKQRCCPVEGWMGSPISREAVRKRVERALKPLEVLGLVERKEGKRIIYWYRFRPEKKEYYRYLYRLMEVCIHETNSVWPLVYLSDEGMQPEGRRITIRTLKRLPAGVKRHTLRACKKLVKELKREYPHIYEEYKKLRRAVIDEQKWFDEFLKRVNSIVYDRGFEIVEHPEQLEEGRRQILANTFYDTIIEYLKHGRQVPIKLGFEGNKITAISRGTSPRVVGFPVLAKGRELKGEIEEMLNEIMGSEKVKEAWNNLKKAEKNTDKEEKELKKMLEDLWFDISIYLSTTTPSKSGLNN